jgi:hypothetical protein
MARSATGPKQKGRFSLNADAKSREREASEITIGERIFHPRRLTLSVMSQWQDVSPDPNSDDDVTAIEALRQVLAQVEVLIVDEEGNAPDQQFLEEQLDFEQAGNILRELGPRFEDESARAGNLQPVDA